MFVCVCGCVCLCFVLVIFCARRRGFLLVLFQVRGFFGNLMCFLGCELRWASVQGSTAMFLHSVSMLLIGNVMSRSCWPAGGSACFVGRGMFCGSRDLCELCLQTKMIEKRLVRFFQDSCARLN